MSLHLVAFILCAYLVYFPFAIASQRGGQGIFSRLKTLEHVTYTVNPGDTLFELAKQYETTVEVIQKINEISRDRIYAGMKLNIPKIKFSLMINKKENRLLLLAGGKPIWRYKVATGLGNATPSGSFKIINKLENPTWYHAGAIVPPDSPENILGTRWMGFDKPGYGIHGTTLPETIGTHASRGCIRMLNSEAEELYALLPLGTQVLVKDEV